MTYHRWKGSDKGHLKGREKVSAKAATKARERQGKG